MKRSNIRILGVLLILLVTITLVSCNEKQEVFYEDDNNEFEILYSSYLSKKNPVVTINISNMGVLELQLFPEVAEKTVNNFITYIESGSYTNSDFHRIIKGFMIQGGMVEKNNQPIKGEFAANGIANDLKHYRGVISMARTQVMDSATSQFFIVHKPSSHLDGNYASFGGLISGFDILDKIANLATIYDAPINKVVIESITVELNGYKFK